MVLHPRRQVARALVCTHETFVELQEPRCLTWRRACREAGEILLHLVEVVDKQDDVLGDDLPRQVSSHGLLNDAGAWP